MGFPNEGRRRYRQAGPVIDATRTFGNLAARRDAADLTAAWEGLRNPKRAAPDRMQS
jgi:hypothetical protein